MSDIQELFNRYAMYQDTIESIRAEIPQLAEAEKLAEETKKQIQEWAKENHAEETGSGWEVKLSERPSFDQAGLLKAHPEMKVFQRLTLTATVKRMKG